MAKKIKTNQQMQEWIDVRRRRYLSHCQVQMARELGLNPAKLGKIDNHKQEPWKLPLPRFIEQLYFERLGKTTPDNVASVEERCRVEGAPNRGETCRQAAACDGPQMKNGARRRRYCGAAVRGADRATTKGGDVRRSCRTDMRWVEQELPPRSSGA